MRKLFGAVILTLAAGCATSRWQVISTGGNSTSSILLNTQTGETWYLVDTHWKKLDVPEGVNKP
jgi:hypothetical protein